MMTLLNRVKNPKTLMSIGTMCLAIGLTLPMFLHRLPASGRTCSTECADSCWVFRL